jgi:hypothetical protein
MFILTKKKKETEVEKEKKLKWERKKKVFYSSFILAECV